MPASPRSHSCDWRAQAATLSTVVVVATLVATTPAFAATFHDIYIFNAPGDGANPTGALVADSQGRLYGTTSNGGKYGRGTVFRLTAPLPGSGGGAWTEEILLSFAGCDGAYPAAGVTLGPDGSVYGTATAGGLGQCGNVDGDGVAFKLANAPGWPVTVLHRYGMGRNGGSPNTPLIFGSDGLLYGTTNDIGTATYAETGTVYSVSPQGSQTEYNLVHAFGKGTDGIVPVGLLAVPQQYYSGFVGATAYAANNGYGTVFSEQILPDGKSSYGVLYTFKDFHPVYFPASPPIAGTGALPKGFYGGGAFGGTHDQGGVYALTPSGNHGLIETTLYSFGSQPNDPRPVGYSGELQLVQADSSGTLIGTSVEGGVYGDGTFFEADPPTTQGGTWTEKVDISFNSHDSLGGGNPRGAPLKLDGAYYGTLSYKAVGNGAVYQVIP